MKSKGAILILHDIRSAENVGSLLRTADAAGISFVYLSSITPGIFDRFGRENTKVAKTALGAHKTIPVEHYEDITILLKSLKEKGYTNIAIEQAENSVDYKTVSLREKSAFIVGNEVTGLLPDVLAQVDIIAEIPMQGKKESLNVSVAGGIALFRMLDR